MADVGHLSADDLTIWTHARNHGFTIVSKDSDFHRMSFVFGAATAGDLAPHRQLRYGGCLRGHLSKIALFEKSRDAAFLIVDPPP